MSIKEVIPKCWPVNLIQKDWSKRRCFIKTTHEYCDEIHNVQLRDDDVWVVTIPKSGTTWMQELVWLLQHDFDFEGAKNEPQELRSPYFEFKMYWNFDGGVKYGPTIEAASPRLIKTHFPLPLLPKNFWTQKPKTIYVVRDPKDALVSAYYFAKNFGNYSDVSLEEAIQEKIDFERETGNTYFQHILEFYQLRHKPWILYTSFERMKANLEQVILEVSQFMGKTISKEQMEHMLHHLSFDEMKKNPQCNHVYEINLARSQRQFAFEDHQFLRSGKIGTYKKELSPKLVTELDEWIEQGLKPYNVTLKELLLLDQDTKNSVEKLKNDGPIVEKELTQRML